MKFICKASARWRKRTTFLGRSQSKSISSLSSSSFLGDAVGGASALGGVSSVAESAAGVSAGAGVSGGGSTLGFGLGLLMIGLHAESNV